LGGRFTGWPCGKNGERDCCEFTVGRREKTRMGRGTSEERIDDAQVRKLLAVLEIFGVEDPAVSFEGGGYYQGVVPRERVATGQV